MLLEPYLLYDRDYAAVERSVGARQSLVVDAPWERIQRSESGSGRNSKAAALVAEFCTAPLMLDLGAVS